VISRPSAQVTRLFLGVVEKGYRRDARTDFDAKYAKRYDAVPRKEVPFGARETNLRFGPQFSLKTAIFGPHFDGTLIFFRPKMALTLDGSRVNDP